MWPEAGKAHMIMRGVVLFLLFAADILFLMGCDIGGRFEWKDGGKLVVMKEQLCSKSLNV